MPKIKKLFGREILDSRGKPTVLAVCVLENGICASASVPSGASTGTAEAFELRDGDLRRYQGLGCRRAVANIGGELHRELVGHVFSDQAELDGMMVALDGTPLKSRLGANAILAVSIAFARVNAQHRGIPLYQEFADILGAQVDALPRLTITSSAAASTRGSRLQFRMS